MPAVPWIQPQAPAFEAEVTVMASRFEVRSLRQVPGFLRASMVLWRQARRSEGVRGLALRAEPFRRTFWTVSAWRDRDAIDAYAASDPHRSVMRSRRGVMKESVFVFWTAPASELPITWEEVERRVAERRAVA